MKTLQRIKNDYAQEQGYEDWKDLVGQSSDYIDDHCTELCICAQREALEKAAGKAQIQHYNTRTGIKQYTSGMGGNGQVYTVDRNSITNPENLIR